MFNTGILDVVIGLVFIYLLYSLLATILQEMIATACNFRAKVLEQAIVRMLEDGEGTVARWRGLWALFRPSTAGGDGKRAVDSFYRHPLITFLGENNRSGKPAYLKRESFSKVIIDLLRGEKIRPGADLRPLIEKALAQKQTLWGQAAIGPETVKYLESVWTDAQGSVDQFRASLENWFDETMERATGWYKRKTQFILFFIGLGLAIVFNIDTLRIVGKLEKDPKLREAIVQQADAFAKSHPTLDQDLARQQAELSALRRQMTGGNLPPATLDSLAQRRAEDSIAVALASKLAVKRDSLIDAADSLLRSDIGKVNSVLGLGPGSFDCGPCDIRCILWSVVGWILTALAISLGAPFWFDLLNKLVKVRNQVAASSTPSPSKQGKAESGISPPKIHG